MKKLLLLFTFCSSLVIAHAQFKDLFDFNGNDGSNPYSSLTLSGGTLFGTTYAGGATNRCPFEDGNAVYQAREILFPYQPLRVYEDDCGVRANADRRIEQNADSSAGINVNIYPNPNNGSFTLAYQLEKGQTGKVYIYTATGVEVGEYILNEQSGKMLISNSALLDGIYFYKLITSDNNTRFGKVIIIK